MAHKEPGVHAMDRADAYERKGLVLRTLGWLLLVEVFLTSNWIWMGLRSGSQFWLWIDMFLGATGLTLIGVAQTMYRKAVVVMASSMARSIRRGEFGYSQEEGTA